MQPAWASGQSCTVSKSRGSWAISHCTCLMRHSTMTHLMSHTRYCCSSTRPLTALWMLLLILQKLCSNYFWSSKVAQLLVKLWQSFSSSFMSLMRDFHSQGSTELLNGLSAMQNWLRLGSSSEYESCRCKEALRCKLSDWYKHSKASSKLFNCLWIFARSYIYQSWAWRSLEAAE